MFTIAPVAQSSCTLRIHSKEHLCLIKIVLFHILLFYPANNTYSSFGDYSTPCTNALSHVLAPTRQKHTTNQLPLLHPSPTLRQVNGIHNLASLFTQGFIPNLENLSHKKAFLSYLILKFGRYGHENDLQYIHQVAKILQKYPDLTKEPFRNFQIIYKDIKYPTLKELSSFLDPQYKGAATVRANLFQIDANKGFWKKVLAYEGPKRFDLQANEKMEVKKHFDHFFNDKLPKTLKQYLANEKISLETRAIYLHSYLIKERQQLQKAGKKTKAISRAIVDLVHSVVYFDTIIKNGLKSSNQLERLTAFQKVLIKRDLFAKKLGYSSFQGLRKKFGNIEPTGMSYEGQLSTKINEWKRAIMSHENSTNTHSKTVRHLSLIESPFRSCLGRDCSTRAYLSKALDPNYHYFTLTDEKGYSDGHITIVLGTANTKTSTLNVAFLDKIQNIPNKDIPLMIESVRKSVLEKGYILALPDDLGGVNGLTNENVIQEFIQAKIKTDSTLKLKHFSPHSNIFEKHFDRGYSKAYQYKNTAQSSVLPILSLKLSERKTFTIDQGPIVTSWKDDTSNLVFKILPDIRKLQNGTLTDKILYIEAIQKIRSSIKDLKNIAFDFDSVNAHYESTLQEWLESNEAPFRLKKTIILNQWVYSEKPFEQLLSYLDRQEAVVLMQNILDTPRYRERFLHTNIEKMIKNIQIKEILLGFDFLKENSVFDVVKFAVGNRHHSPELYNKIMKELSVEEKHSTLLFAAAHGHREIVQALIDAGADVNHQDEFGHTVLYWAAESGYLETVQTLIDAGADVNLRTKDNSFNDERTALSRAAYKGHLEIVQTLIDAGADVNHQDNYRGTALIKAVDMGHLEIVQALIDAGADVNHQDHYGYTALKIARRWGYTEIEEALIKSGVKKDLSGESLTVFPWPV